MISRTNRQRPSSGNKLFRCLLLGAVALSALLATTVHAAPIEQRLEEGVIDWSRAELRTVGVGTPRILSPTGGVTDDSPIELARKDAERRLEKLVGRLRWNQKDRLSQHPLWLQRGNEAAKQLRATALQRGSDGTVHLHVVVPMSQLMKRTQPTSPDLDAPANPKLWIRVKAPLRPCAQLTTQHQGEPELTVGLGDPVNTERRGLYWQYDTGAPSGDADAILIDATVSESPSGSVRLTLSVPEDEVVRYREIARTADYTILITPPQKGRP